MVKQSTEIKHALDRFIVAMREYYSERFGILLDAVRKPKFIYQPGSGWYIISTSNPTPTYLGKNAAQVGDYFDAWANYYNNERIQYTNQRKEAQNSSALVQLSDSEPVPPSDTEKAPHITVLEGALVWARELAAHGDRTVTLSDVMVKATGEAAQEGRALGLNRDQLTEYQRLWTEAAVNEYARRVPTAEPGA